jgi:hypothetical protein
MSRRLAYTLASLLAASAAFAQPAAAPAPATRPSTRPHLATTRLVGAENPKRLLTIYAIAMAAGDADRVRDCYVADTADERALVDAYAHMASSVGALRKAATDKYGPDGFDNIGFGKMFAAEIKRIESSRLFVDGPKALAFTNNDAKPDLNLVHLDTGWKISATSFANPARHAARIEAQAAAYDELAKEIAAGKYRLATDAQVAGRNKVRDAKQAVEEKLKAAPTTQPTNPQQQQTTTGTK